MNNKFEIAGRYIGPNYEPAVIAEIGINHNGDLETAIEMVDAAKRAGVEIIKHQTHIVDDEMISSAQNIIPLNADISIYEIMQKCSLSEIDEYELMKYVTSKGMIFISTPFSRAAANRLNKFEVPAYKIGSGECNNYPLLEHIASFGKPIIISTGMNNIKSVQKAVNIMFKHNVPFALMHTTNIYPTPNKLVRLGGMQQLMNTFQGIPVGLSDHTTSNLASFAAVALGANLIERHFTDSMNRVGPDIICSMDEVECKELIDGTKEIYQMLGGNKEAAIEEQPTIKFAFASVVSISDIKAGEMLTKENIWVKRPGTGEILAEEYEDFLGKIAKIDICSDVQIKRSYII